MSPRVVPCGWVPDLQFCAAGPCCPDVNGAGNEAVAQIASDTAVALLWALTGRQFGCCPVTVRPCKPQSCKDLSLSDIIFFEADRRALGGSNMGVLSYFPTLVDGAVFNIACGCARGCCKCRSDCEVLLPGPVCTITEVEVDGVVRDPSTYALFDHHKLVFLADAEGETNCPPCQNYNLPLGEVGTWSVTYTIGRPVPPGGEVAAGMLACEIGKMLIGQECALPARVQNVSRRGIDVAFADPFELADAGLTGIPFVDLFIRTWNPDRLKGRTIVWSPDLDIVRRET